MGSGCEGLRVLMVFSFLRWSLVFFFNNSIRFYFAGLVAVTPGIFTRLWHPQTLSTKRSRCGIFFGIGNHQATQFGAQTPWEFALEVGPPPYQQTHIFLNDGTCLGWNLQTVQLRQPCFTDISGICYDIHRLNGLYALLRSNSNELRFQLSPLPGLSWVCLRWFGLCSPRKIHHYLQNLCWEYVLFFGFP